MGHSVDEFFVALDEDSAQGKVLPNWWVTTCFSCIFDVPEWSSLTLGMENFTWKLVFFCP
jgi:hypothetical protein